MYVYIVISKYIDIYMCVYARTRAGRTRTHADAPLARTCLRAEQLRGNPPQYIYMYKIRPQL